MRQMAINDNDNNTRFVWRDARNNEIKSIQGYEIAKEEVKSR